MQYLPSDCLSYTKKYEWIIGEVVDNCFDSFAPIPDSKWTNMLELVLFEGLIRQILAQNSCFCWIVCETNSWNEVVWCTIKGILIITCTLSIRELYWSRTRMYTVLLVNREIFLAKAHYFIPIKCDLPWYVIVVLGLF